MTDSEKYPGSAAPVASALRHSRVQTGQTLRQRAEAAFQKNTVQSQDSREASLPQTTRQMLHELGVHQIELEMQNEELRGSQLELEASRARYFNFYDLAPVGYLTLSEQGLILETNLTFATLLGVFRGELLKQPISRYIHKGDQDIFYRHRKELIESGQSQECELRMVKNDGTQFWAHLTSTAAQNADGMGLHRLVLSDITLRKQAEQFEQFRSRILELLAGNWPLPVILEAIARGVEQLNPAMLCSILLLDSTGTHLGKGVAPSLPDFYNAALDGIAIGAKVGCCGTAAFTGERVIVEDIAAHPYWTRDKELATRAGLASCWSQPIRSSSGQVLGTFAIYHREAHTPAESDIYLVEQSAHLASIAIEQIQAEEKLRLAASVFTHAHEGIMITAADATIIEVNDAFTRITGYSRDEVLGRKPSMLKSDHQNKEFFTAMWQDLVEKGHWYGEIWNRRKNGEIYVGLETISTIRDAQGNTQQYVALFSDITATKAYQQQLEYIAHYDVLTSLPNRVLLADRLQQAMAQAQRRRQPMAVVFLDLDEFKDINDNHGHEAGDRLLTTVASRMKQVLREGDTLARIGGDEFVAILPDLPDVATSLPMINRLLAAAAQPVQVGDLMLQVSASLGVTFYPNEEEVNVDQLLCQADQAMYQAKQAGKNRYHVFDTVQHSNIRGYYENMERIRCALIAHEFVLHYQPKVNMRTGKIVGAEALIRWQHPEKGLLPPAMFLPAIENHPLAIEIGEWVIATALTQLELWHAAGLSITVSVNIGARQLLQTDFIECLRMILAEHPNVNPRDMELEVLETSALENLTQVSQVIDGCRDIGVSFSLDDFGTGYSSLTHLKHLPVTRIKIAQSFVSDMLNDPDDLAILKGILAISTAFRREVIAEGVESIAHGAILLQLGCDLAQGYGIAPPMPANELPCWAATWHTDPSWYDLHPVSNEDLPLLFANAEHRVWFTAIGAFLKGERKAPPPLDRHQCHLGSWLKTAGLIRYGAHPAFKTIETLHTRVHTLAAELVALHACHNQESLAKLDELHKLIDALLEQLQRPLCEAGFIADSRLDPSPARANLRAKRCRQHQQSPSGFPV